MKINEIIKKIEARFPLEWQEDFDNCGVQCGDVLQECSGAMVCFNFSEQVVDEAVAAGANLVVSHHPLIFRGLKKIEPKDEMGRIIFKAIKNNLLLYSMHTNMDSGTFGGNWLFAKKLELSDIEVLEPKTDVSEPERDSAGMAIYKDEVGLSSVGLGRVGNLPHAMSAQQFFDFLKDKLNVSRVRYSGDTERKIRRVAVCGGAGNSLIDIALRSHADAYVTGDLKYHDFFRADNRMLMVDLGHFETECFIKDILFNELQRCSDVPVRLFENEKSGIEYY